MITAFILAVAFTIGVSALCSLLEAMILSTTTAEIEALKKAKPTSGKRLEYYKERLEETSSAILGLNTIANTIGATLVGGLAVKIWADGTNVLFNVSVSMALAILVFSEIIPKNVGVLYRPQLQPVLVAPLSWICHIMTPVSRLVGFIVRFLLRPNSKETADSDAEIMLLAEKSANEGNLTSNERQVIHNALQLDEVLVETMMTPRSVVCLFDDSQSIGSLFKEKKHIPFGRIPVYHEQSDNITGIVRRRDILAAKAEEQDHRLISEFARPPLYIPESATADDALQTFLKAHQQLAVVVDEFGSMSGVITMEDVMEYIIGQEIYEEDDPAVDMRELARKRQFAVKRKNRRKEN
ncbi:MAG: hemolysin family protein [Coraliomargaritaceae bacterium]